MDIVPREPVGSRGDSNAVACSVNGTKGDGAGGAGASGCNSDRCVRVNDGSAISLAGVCDSSFAVPYSDFVASASLL